MALVESFEEMKSWKKARELNKIIYQQSNQLQFQQDYALKNQIRKTSISVMSNIAEGFERLSKKEFKYFLNVAKGSAGELRSQLYIASDLSYIDNEKFTNCMTLVNDISCLLNKFMEKLNIAILKEQAKPSQTT